MKVQATHYICIKGKDGEDLLILRRGEIKEVSKKELGILAKEAEWKYKIVEDGEK